MTSLGVQENALYQELTSNFTFGGGREKTEDEALVHLRQP